MISNERTRVLTLYIQGKLEGTPRHIEISFYTSLSNDLGCVVAVGGIYDATRNLLLVWTGMYSEYQRMIKHTGKAHTLKQDSC